MNTTSTESQQVNRKRLLKQLKAVQPGIAKREFVVQSSCFVFRDGKVMSFNGQAAYSSPCNLRIECAVSAKRLLGILKTIRDEELSIRVSDEELTIIGAESETSIKIDTEIHLPIDNVEIPKRWRSLPDDFDEALRVTVPCAARNDNNHKLNCVHFTPNRLEACDNFQLARYRITTGMKGSRLVNAKCLKQVMRSKMTHFSTTRKWYHFRNSDRLIISVWCWTEAYENLDDILDCSGTAVSLPDSLEDVIERLMKSAPRNGGGLLRLRSSRGRLLLSVDGPGGLHEEKIGVKYTGRHRDVVVVGKHLQELTRLVNHEHDGGASPCGAARFDWEKGIARFEGKKSVYAICLEPADKSARRNRSRT